MEHRALDLAPLRDMSLARHDHVGRHAQRVQDSTQPYHLIEAARHVALDYEKVEIALGIGLSPSVGAEQDHPGGRLRGSRQELGGTFDELLRGHLAHGTAGIGAWSSGLLTEGRDPQPLGERYSFDHHLAVRDEPIAPEQIRKRRGDPRVVEVTTVEERVERRRIYERRQSVPASSR